MTDKAKTNAPVTAPAKVAPPTSDVLQAEKKSAKEKFTAVHPVDHDGAHYAEGKTIWLEAEHSAPLLKVGAIK